MRTPREQSQIGTHLAIADAPVTARIVTDYTSYRYFGGRHDFDTWWARHADDYSAVSS